MSRFIILLDLSLSSDIGSSANAVLSNLRDRHVSTNLSAFLLFVGRQEF